MWEVCSVSIRARVAGGVLFVVGRALFGSCFTKFAANEYVCGGRTDKSHRWLRDVVGVGCCCRCITDADTCFDFSVTWD